MHNERIDGNRGVVATITFATKDRKAQGYWRLAQVTGPDFAVLLQVQVSAPTAHEAARR